MKKIQDAADSFFKKNSPKSSQSEAVRVPMFGLNLRRPILEVEMYSPARIRRLIEDDGATSLKDYTGYDVPLFKDDVSALNFAREFKAARAQLVPLKKNTQKVPMILLKRHYMILTMLGLKMQTYREYRKNWTPGQLFGFHDQTYCLVVRLKSLTETSDGFCYKFDLV
jgi:hypothetical protein